MPAKVEALGAAAALMGAFAERTGLGSGPPSSRRYLWTDAFAVCNLLGLARETGERRWAELALLLVDEVHRVLGRHRPDDVRTGWISGLGEREGASHPTRGGLRIGKPLPERRADEPFDERLEWERDGQYFHYLTKWMHALDQVSRATGEPRYNVWARELAAAAHAAFVRAEPASGARRMAWKLSTDLARPLVPSMGQHDPLDGLFTCLQLEAMAAELGTLETGPRLEAAVADFASLLAAVELRTADPLGLGGLLADAGRLAQLGHRADIDGGALLERLLEAARTGLSAVQAGHELRQSADRRLAFRELGLAIGLSAVELLSERTAASALARPRVREHVEALARHASLGSALVSFWSDPAHQASPTWPEHHDINAVMLATSLAPEGFLVLAQRPNG